MLFTNVAVGTRQKTEKVVFGEELVKTHHDALESLEQIYERKQLLVF